MSSIWKRAKINDPLMFCGMSIDPLEYGLIGSLCYFLSPSSNYFFHPTSSMTITLLDIWSLTSLSPFVKFDDQSTGAYPFFSTTLYLNLPYNDFIDRYVKTDGPISLEEHVAFLLC